MPLSPVRAFSGAIAPLVLLTLAGVPTSAAAPAWEVALADSAEPGRPFVLEGRVLALPDSQPLRDVAVHLWHADARGSYGRPATGRFARLEGHVRTNVAGGFRARSILPGPAEGFAHVHYSVSGTGLKTRTGTLNLARSHGAGSDTSYAKLPYMIDPTASQEWAFVEPDEAGFHGSCRLYVKRRVPR
jgi:hypothetical protein